MKRWCIGILLLSPFFTKAQIITTFAGCVSMSCSGLGDGGPATAANLDDPCGNGAFDKYGNYYFAEALGQRVRKVNTSDTITTVSGTGSSGYTDSIAATAAMLSSPGAVILDTFGNLYIADHGNERIRKITVSTGIITTICGNGTGAFYGEGIPATAAEIWGPNDICFDKFGNLYIADTYNYRVRKINTSGIISTFAGGAFGVTSGGDGGPATAATFNSISGVTADDTGNIYIADYNAGKVRKVDTTGIITTIAGNGSVTYSGDGIAATAAQIAPSRLGFDTSGNLYVADEYNLRVYKIDRLTGILYTVAGDGMTGYSGDGVAATAASIDYPSGVAFDPCGNLYVTEVNNDRIRRIAFNPTCTTLDSAALNAPAIKIAAGIAIYPNPANNEITITSNANIISVSVTNLMGQALLSQYFKSETVEVSIGSLADGVYFVIVTDDKGNKTVKKIIKQ